MQRCILRSELQPRVKLGDSGIEIRQLDVGNGEISAHGSVVGMQVRGLLELWNGALRVAALHQGQTEIVVSLGVIGAQLDGLLKGCDRGVDVSRMLTGDS